MDDLFSSDLMLYSTNFAQDFEITFGHLSPHEFVLALGKGLHDFSNTIAPF